MSVEYFSFPLPSLHPQLFIHPPSFHSSMQVCRKIPGMIFMQCYLGCFCVVEFGADFKFHIFSFPHQLFLYILGNNYFRKTSGLTIPFLKLNFSPSFIDTLDVHCIILLYTLTVYRARCQNFTFKMQCTLICFLVYNFLSVNTVVDLCNYHHHGGRRQHRHPKTFLVLSLPRHPPPAPKPFPLLICS